MKIIKYTITFLICFFIPLLIIKAFGIELSDFQYIVQATWAAGYAVIVTLNKNA